jgi:2-polyprenyl-3-methyl-5-hydroxy-6-metoxy-1,4-benzoquinol methylase
MGKVNGPLGPGFYDSVYSRSDHYKGPPDESPYLPLWKAVLECLEPGWRILDVGCGPGQFARLCVDAGHPYVGLDFSEEAITLARNRVPEAKFLLTDVSRNRVPLEEGDYDVATFIEFLEHVEDDMGILGSVPPGKKVVLSVPNYGGIEHVRFFDSIESVVDRYGPLVNFSKMGELAWGSTSRRVYLLVGVRALRRS